MSRPARLRRRAALVALWAYVLGTLLGTAHLALTEHSVCADHGAIVHGEVACGPVPDGQPVDQIVDPAAALAGAALEGPRVVASDVATDEHEHCATAFALRADRRFEPPPVTACVTPCVRAPQTDRAGLLRVQDDRLSFAPKQSPPA